MIFYILLTSWSAITIAIITGIGGGWHGWVCNTLMHLYIWIMLYSIFGIIGDNQTYLKANKDKITGEITSYYVYSYHDLLEPACFAAIKDIAIPGSKRFEYIEKHPEKFTFK